MKKTKQVLFSHLVVFLYVCFVFSPGMVFSNTISILDQNQLAADRAIMACMSYDNHPAGDDLLVQTFTAGRTGYLDHIDIFLSGLSGADQLGIWIDRATNPGGAINLGFGYPSSNSKASIISPTSSFADGWNSLDLRGLNVSLDAGFLYGIGFRALPRSGINPITGQYTGTLMSSFYVGASSVDTYAGGSLYVSRDGGIWNDRNVDAAFRTWMVNPVPEPSTILLFCAGLAGLAAVGRRRRD